MSLNDDDGKVVAFRRGPRPTLPSLDFPDITATGIIRPTCANARIAIGLLGITCEYDEFHDKLLIGGQPIGQYAGELSDHACVYLRQLIDRQYSFDPGREKTFDACLQLCLENRFDPINDYFDSLEWDGVERVSEWLSTYLGAENTELTRAIGKIALVAQVRRAKEPGCKFDQIIVLEGEEGVEKSTALLTLAGGAENFSDQTILGQGDKEQQELLRGVWVYEIADLSNIRKAEVEHVKAFASRTHDRARPAYGKVRVDLPRRGVIWATTNNSEYLKSQTGNRRFWPIPVAVLRPIDIDSLARDRDQLFAEACALEAAGTSIVLHKELWGAAAKEQEERREADPWEDILRSVRGIDCDGEERILSQRLLVEHLSIPRERQKHADLLRVGTAMRRLGWKGPKLLRVGGDRGKGYWKARDVTESPMTPG
jgi:predicted P-loop ATPase